MRFVDVVSTVCCIFVKSCVCGCLVRLSRSFSEPCTIAPVQAAQHGASSSMMHVAFVAYWISTSPLDLLRLRSLTVRACRSVEGAVVPAQCRSSSFSSHIHTQHSSMFFAMLQQRGSSSVDLRVVVEPSHDSDTQRYNREH